MYDDHRRHQTEAMAALQPEPMLDLLDRSGVCDKAKDVTVAIFRNLKSAKLFPYEHLSLEEYRERFEVFKTKELGSTAWPCKKIFCICTDTEKIKQRIENGLDAVNLSVKITCLDCIIKESTGATASVARPCRIPHA